jgi:SAM-dependent methyltransferase
MITAARRRWPEQDFRSGTVGELPLDDGSMAGYRADKVFHAVPDPAAALAEARRVLAPGGRIVLIGQDWDTVIIDSDDPDLTRTIVHARTNTVPNPQAARRYRNLLLDSGFGDVTIERLPVLSVLARTAHERRLAAERRLRGGPGHPARRPDSRHQRRAAQGGRPHVHRPTRLGRGHGDRQAAQSVL